MHTALPIRMPRITAMALVQVEPGWTQQPHAHALHEICYVAHGRGTLRSGSQEVPLTRGAIYLFLPGEPHGGASSTDEPLRILYLAVQFPGSVQVLRETTPQPFFLTGARAQAVRPGLRLIAAALARSPGRHASDPVDGAMLAPVLAVLAAMVEPVAQWTEGSARQREVAGHALSALRAARTLPSLTLLARQEGLSPSHLGDVLRAACGCTYPMLLARERVRRARELIMADDLPLREIARRVGLSGIPALSRIFRRVTGRTPGAFRP